MTILCILCAMHRDFHIAMTYLRLLLRADDQVTGVIEEEIGDLAELLDGDYLPGSLVCRMFHHFAAKGVPSWVVRYGGSVGVTSHGPLGFAALSSPDLFTALGVLAEFFEIRINSHQTTLQQSDGRLEFILSDHSGDELAGRWLMESGFQVVQSLIETITGHSLGDNAEISFTHPPPPYATELTSVYQLNCRYNQPQNKLSIPASWANIPSPLYDEATYRTNLTKCREIQIDLQANSGNIAVNIKSRLLNHFERRISGQIHAEKIPSLDSLAAEQCVSTRTLIRKLRQQNTSYKELLSEVRQEHARYLLERTHLTAADIGEKLGYQEAANFSRAFKQWYGSTPTQWRRQGKHPDEPLQAVN